MLEIKSPLCSNGDCGWVIAATSMLSNCAFSGWQSNDQSTNYLPECQEVTTVNLEEFSEHLPA